MAVPVIIMKEHGLNIEKLSHNRVTWVNIEKPTERETEYLAKNYPFHALDLDDCLSRTQRPKIDKYDDYLFIVLHFPVYDKQSRVTTASQVSVFLGEDYLITLHSGELKPLAELYKECQTSERSRTEFMGRSPSYLLYFIIDRLIDYCFPVLFRIVNRIEKVEDDIFSKKARSSVQEISELRRDVISYRRIMKPQNEVIEQLEREELPVLKEDPDVYFGDIADHSRKILDTLDDYREIVTGLNDTNNTLFIFRTNQIMKILTVISIITLPLVVIPGVLGMNIWPMVSFGGPLGFTIVMGIVFLITFMMLIMFRMIRWL
ncbi:MAG: magnesium/cobalt transporter CorA [Chloroflexi bacterium]|nr:magnesium/cobalt transporter CorA [Chloroflexota bacterium]